MKTSESIKNLTKALLEAQKQMGAAVKGAKNPFFKSNYADLPTVMEVVKGPLNDAGIIILQPATFQDGRNFITTTLIHSESGEWIQGNTEVVSKKDPTPQDFGAAQTYARRFGLQSLLFIPSEDDDGNSISGRTPAKTPTYVPPVTKATTVSVAPVPMAGAATQAGMWTKEELASTPAATPLAEVKKSSFRNRAPKATEVSPQAASVAPPSTSDDSAWT